jgi:hypothetical protein
MAEAKMQVSTHDVSRMVIARLTAREDELRQLLSYCEANTPGEGFKLTGSEEAYADIRDKLRAILDGE